MTQPTEVTMELADLVAKLVLDVSDGVHEAMRLQEERHEEMVAAVSLDAFEFARLTVPPEELDRELARLFPSSDPHYAHGIYVGAQYAPVSQERHNESPPFLALLGIQLERADYVQTRRAKRFVLAGTAVEKIRDAVHTRLGIESQSVLRATLNRGVPRVIVDSGKVNAKVWLGVQASISSPGNKATSVHSKNPRLLARLVDDRAPQNQQCSVDTLSELEIRFKTVT